MSNSVKNDESLKTKNKTSWNINSLFWGLLFVLIGGLFFAQNLGWVDIHWRNILSLWPVVIIVAGLSILAVRNIMWRVLLWSVTLASLVVIGMTATGYLDFTPDTRSTSAIVSVINKDIKSAVVNVKAGGSTINIDTMDQSEVVVAELNSNIAELEKNVRVEGDVQNIDLNMVTNRHMWFGGMDNNLDISIGTKLPTSFVMDIGAADANIDLSGAIISGFSLKSGASSADLKLGSRSKNVNVSLESGASSTTIRIPSDSGVRLTFDGGLVDKELADLKENGSNIYESPNYASSKNTVHITAKLGAASFEIVRY